MSVGSGAADDFADAPRGLVGRIMLVTRRWSGRNPSAF
jgi:hypothetical protein